MGAVQDVQLEIQGSPCSPKEAKTTNQLPLLPTGLKSWLWWARVALYSFFILAGQTAATLLQRFYYNQGGNSKWMNTIVTSGGFPLLLPLYLLSSSSSKANSPPLKELAPCYIGLGLISVVGNLLYSYGLLFLPVSTYSLVCATQLVFNAIFSYFLNSQKFTALIFNSVVLVTISAVLLGVSSDSHNAESVSKGKYLLGFMLTLAASAVFSLGLSLTQLAFQKLIKKGTFSVVLEMLMCTCLVSTVVAVVGLFASGEWRKMDEERKGFETGEVSYAMTLVWIAVCWQVFNVGVVELTFGVSSLFSNMMCTVALPLVPVFAVVFFHDKMDGVKIMAMLIALWGFVNYMYQDYIDYLRVKNDKGSEGACSEMNEVVA